MFLILNHLFPGAHHAPGEHSERSTLRLPRLVSRLTQDVHRRLQVALPELPLQLRLESGAVRRQLANEGTPVAVCVH